ncbi:type II toxin-antitoxin system PemK/MazF family toxin [Vibrio sp. SS-MA-C1-2]|uniref:type II toxin-antitoxin system PemK/MazF family toxin n=1 Tax=Vibrio sp. SS-MA-C1-2 TaxID=2908646 RepID=UPI0038FC121A
MNVKKTRPCVIISPNDMNQALQTILIAPMTSTHRGWKFRPLITGPKHQSELALDQLRAIDKKRVIKQLGHLSTGDQKRYITSLKSY